MITTKILQEPIVTIDNILDTYTGRDKEFEQYQKAKIMTSEGISREDIAKKLKVPKSRIKNWLSKTHQPKSFKAIRALNGILPLTYFHENFNVLNFLSSLCFWSGSVRTFNGRYAAGFQIKDDNFKEDILSALETKLNEDKLNITFRPEPNKLSKKGIMLGENGSPYARLIYAMWHANNNEETKQGLFLPSYISNLLDIEDADYTEKNMIRPIIDDFVKLLLFSKSRTQGKYRIIDLPAKKDEQVALNSAKEVLRIFEKIYPKAELTEDSVRANYNKNRQSYYPRILVRAKNIELINGYYSGLFDISTSSLLSKSK